MVQPDRSQIAHERCDLNAKQLSQEHTHTLTFVNYLFSRAAMVTQMHCCVTLNTHVQPCCNINLPVHVY